jgi:hypothetical protein
MNADFGAKGKGVGLTDFAFQSRLAGIFSGFLREKHFFIGLFFLHP